MTTKRLGGLGLASLLFEFGGLRIGVLGFLDEASGLEKGRGLIVGRNMESGSQTFARAAKALTIVALVFLALPVFVMLTGYVEGLGLFVALYLLASVAATGCILVASIKSQWKQRGVGWKLLAALYGFSAVIDINCF